MADLVIVESPGKTGKINQLLGAGYVVRGRRQAARWHASDGPRRRRAASARARGYGGRLEGAVGDRGDASADLAQGRLSGTGEHGGLQLAVQPLKAERYERVSRASSEFAVACPAPQSSMRLAPGGLMRQQIYEDEYGLDAWEPSARSRCFVHILNSVDFLHVTGAEPPTEPPTARAYTDAGMPWFEYYAADRKALAGARKLAGLDSVASARLKRGDGILAGNEPIPIPQVIHLGSRSGVREGQF